MQRLLGEEVCYSLYTSNGTDLAERSSKLLLADIAALSAIPLHAARGHSATRPLENPLRISQSAIRTKGC